MGPILVFGHRNPDNDSICSAVAYAHLKNITDPDEVYVAARLGDVPAETRWVFERFGVDLPDAIPHVHTRVRDVMTEEVVSISPEASMLQAGRMMRENDVRALPVVTDDGAVVGLVSQRMLAERYIEETEIAGFAEMPVSIARLARVLDGVVLSGDPAALVSGDVLIGAAEPDTMVSRIKPGDILIVGDRVRTQPMAIEAGVALLVVTTGVTPPDEVIALARSKGTALIVTEQDTYSTARLIALAHAIGDLMETDSLIVHPETLLSEAAEDLLSSHHREAVVIDDASRCVGVITRTNIARGIRRRVVLVDHNESSQSAAGIEEATVVEIVDHHRVGDVQTAGPIMFLNLPVGSTATIVAWRFSMLDVEMPRPIAGILLAALLTDTVLLKSPTTTELDRHMCDRLAAVAGEDPVEFGMQVFAARAAAGHVDPEDIVRTDLKEYRIGDVVAAIAQFEAVDIAPMIDGISAIREAMEALRVAKGYDIVVLMLTDIVREGSEIIAVGRVRTVEKSLDVSLDSGSVWMPGVLSRKKQIAARLVDSAG